MEQSPKWTLNKEDWCRWGKNTLTFLGPLVLMYLTFVGGEIQKDGLQPTDFAVNNLVAGAMILYVINSITDLLKKLAVGK